MQNSTIPVPSQTEIQSLVSVYKQLPETLRWKLVTVGGKLKDLNEACADLTRAATEKTD